MVIFLWMRYFNALQYIHHITFDTLQLIDGRRSAKTKGDSSKILVCSEQYLYHKNRDNQGAVDLVTVGILICFPVYQMHQFRVVFADHFNKSHTLSTHAVDFTSKFPNSVPELLAQKSHFRMWVVTVRGGERWVVINFG